MTQSLSLREGVETKQSSAWIATAGRRARNDKQSPFLNALLGKHERRKQLHKVPMAPGFPGVHWLAEQEEQAVMLSEATLAIVSE
jgi:hypothetical protein